MYNNMNVCFKDNTDVVKHLCEHKDIAVNLQNKHGDSALTLAAARGNAQTHQLEKN